MIRHHTVSSTSAPRRRTVRTLARLGLVAAAAATVAVPAQASAATPSLIDALPSLAGPAPAALDESVIAIELTPDSFEVIETSTGPLLVPTATTQQNVIILTNQQRARVGAPAVRYSQALTIAAQRHANDIAKRLRLTHTGADGSSAGTRMRKAGYSWTRCAENIAVGQTGSTQVVNAWMASSGHRANMLNKAYKHIGIGIAWGGGRIWWVMDLAA